MIDSGCSKHMTGDESLFVSLEMKSQGSVTFANSESSRVIGIGSIGISNSSTINNVILVEGIKVNLLSVSQLCDNDFDVKFLSDKCIISHKLSSISIIGYRRNNVFYADLDNLEDENMCLNVMYQDVSLWHRRLGHVSIDLMTRLRSSEHVRGLPKLKFDKLKLCDACQLGKQHKSSFASKTSISTKHVLEMLHLDLFGEIDVVSLGGAKYVFVIVDDYSRYTWIILLTNKSDAFKEFAKLCRKIQNDKGLQIK